ncbi:MAG: hypothetical protein QW683_08710 [Candidatus Caldarchaeum sp.]
MARTATDVFKSAVWIKRGAGVKMILDASLPTFNPNDSGHTIRVQDSILTEDGLEGDLGIIDALIAKAEHGHDLDFSLLRPRGSLRRGGKFSSGPESFEALANTVDAYRYEPSLHNLLTMVGTINHVMIQGGDKKGIIIVSYPVVGDRLDEFLSVDLLQIPGSVKREVRFPEDNLEALHAYVSLSPETQEKVLSARNHTSLLMSRERVGKNGESLYTNVCEGIYLADNSTCLIVRVPLGRLRIEEIPDAYLAAYKFGRKLWEFWHSEYDGSDSSPFAFNPAESDRQIAIDPFGLANLLAHYRITYGEFLKAFRKVRYANPSNWKTLARRNRRDTDAIRLVKSLIRAHYQVAEYNKGFFDRVFTVEPSQAHAYRERDFEGNTFARGIWAAWDSTIERISDHQGREIHQLPGFETIRTNPKLIDSHWELNELWYVLMRGTGLAHAVSVDTYLPITPEFLKDWIYTGATPSLYYQFHEEVSQVVRKTVPKLDLDGLDLGIQDSGTVCDPTVGFCQVCGA